MKKAVLIFLSMMLLCTSLTGCGDKKSAVINPTTELTIYLDVYSKGKLARTISEYKRVYPEVNLNLVDLSQLDIFEYNTKLKNEVQSGKGPDVIDVSTMAFENAYKTVNSGVFCELAPLIEADEAFNLDDYNKVVMDAGVFDSKRYLMPITFKSPFLMTTQSILDETKIDRAKLTDIISIATEFDRYLAEGDKRIFKETRQWYMGLYQFLGLDFADYSNASYNLDEELITQAAELFQRIYPQDKPVSDGMTFSSTFDGFHDLSTGQGLFKYYYWGDISSIVSNAAALVGTDEKPIFLPIKTADNKLQATVLDSVGINANSPNKKNAFNFIKTMLSDPVQNSDRYPMDYPVRNESLDKRIADCKEDAAERDTTLFESDGIIMESPDQAFFDEFSASLKGIERCRFEDPATGILSYELNEFYEGSKSIADCIKAAKSKLEIYVSE